MDERTILEKLREKKFENVVSLGFFCSVARDIEKLGLRSFSGPVDWVWSTWNGVYNSMQNEFSNYMPIENLAQSNHENCIYADRVQGIVFFHDFSKYKSLEKQYKDVKAKYDRRIGYFYENIKNPTLFIRYIWDGAHNGKRINEIRQIEKDYEKFLKLIKMYNEENEIVFIANSDLHSDVLPIFYVEKEQNDVVNRNPIFANNFLREYLENMDFADRKRNLAKYTNKVKREKSIGYRAVGKCKFILCKMLLKEYIYEKRYDHDEYSCG